MKLKSLTKFLIKGLNQERVLNGLSSFVDLYEVERHENNLTSFKCHYRDRKKVEKFLKDKQLEVLSVESSGLVFLLDKFLSCYGLWSAIIVFFVCYAFQYQFVLKFEVAGVKLLSDNEIIAFVKENSSRKKSEIDTKDLEISLYDNFEEISFVSCAIKGQTLLINIKEKLLPEEMVGNFQPITAQEDAKITKIELISGTLCVSVGDYVKKGDVLVEPYVEDTSGTIKAVQAEANIVGEVYNQASIDHYDARIEIRRTGRVAQKNEITLFGLNIYTFVDDFDFKMYEVEIQEENLSKNLLLPFVMKRCYIFEIEEVLVEQSFAEAKEHLVEKARENALKNCEECDIILYEFYTTRELAGVTIVNYCVVTEENIGGKNGS